MFRCLGSILALLCAPVPGVAQEQQAAQDTAPGWSVDLGVSGYGLSLGNSSRWNGIRLNFSDRGVREVNGLNVSFGAPKENPRAVFRGAAIGAAPLGRDFRGLTVGLLGMVAHRSMTGISIAGLGVVSNGVMSGVNVAGLGTVAEGDMTGINLAGLGTVSDGRMTGLNAAGLGTVADGDMVGINLGGLAAVSRGRLVGLNVAGLGLVSDGDMWGANLAGLAAVSEGKMTGLNVASLAVVAGRRMSGVSAAGVAVVAEGGVRGLAVAGIAVVANDGPIEGLATTLGAVESRAGVSGLAIAGYRIRSARVTGWAVPLVTLQAEQLQGVSVSAYNRVSAVQRGLAIGLLNYARELHGFQVGVINIAGNNRGLARVLPVINFHLN